MSKDVDFIRYIDRIKAIYIIAAVFAVLFIVLKIDMLAVAAASLFIIGVIDSNP